MLIARIEGNGFYLIITSLTIESRVSIALIFIFDLELEARSVPSKASIGAIESDKAGIVTGAATCFGRIEESAVSLEVVEIAVAQDVRLSV